MINTTIFPAKYIQGYNAIDRLGDEMKRLGSNGYMVCDPFVHENLLDGFRKNVESAVKAKFEKFEGECSDEEVERLVKIAQKEKCDLVVGIGGGKTLDTAKAVAYEMKVPVIIVPTIASTDAPCSALSVIYTPKGEFKRYLILPSNPNVVLVDTGIIVQAPSRFLVAGMGDALATWFEADSAMTNYAANMTGDTGSMTAYSLSRLCYDTLLEFGVLAKSSCEARSVTPAFEKIVEANTLLSGLGFESGGLGAAHSIHNGLTVLEQVHDYYHGEKVAFGVITSLFLTDKPEYVINEVYDFCESVGLPTTLADIGLEDISDDELMKVAEATCAEGETIHNEPIPVTPDSVKFALKTADEEGRRRKAGR